MHRRCMLWASFFPSRSDSRLRVGTLNPGRLTQDAAAAAGLNLTRQVEDAAAHWYVRRRLRRLFVQLRGADPLCFLTRL